MATQLTEKPTGVPALLPFRGFDTVRQMMDALFDTKNFPAFAGEVEPAVNLYEKDGTYTLECAVPGYTKDEITVEARGDEVTVKGAYKHEATDDQNHYHRRELRQGSFVRTVALPAEIDPDHVAAKLENGMLTVTLQPTKPIASKTIPVTAG